MTNIRKLMGRLNPTTIRYDTGRGGIPELTPQDIAGALGMVADPLAREVFCAIWWPEGAALTREKLLGLIALRQRAEIDRQWRKVQVARLELHIAEENASAKACLTAVDQYELERLRSKMLRAKDECWPSVPKMYPVIRSAVIEEMCSPNHCKVCGGRGEASSAGLVVACKQCDGTGSSPVSNRQRAFKIGRDEVTYRGEWKAVYEWTHEIVSDAEQTASRQVLHALGRDAA